MPLECVMQKFVQSTRASSTDVYSSEAKHAVTEPSAENFEGVEVAVTKRMADTDKARLLVLILLPGPGRVRVVRRAHHLEVLLQLDAGAHRQ